MATKAIVSGVHDTQVGALPESTCMSLHTEASLGALADAGLKPSDIDGLLTAYSFASPQLMLGGVLAEYLGIRPKVKKERKWVRVRSETRAVGSNELLFTGVMTTLLAQ